MQQAVSLEVLEAMAVAESSERGGRGKVHAKLLCPKPRRAACSAFELLKPPRKIKSSSPHGISWEGDAGYEISDFLISKAPYGESGSPLSFACGSPPSRSSNPLIHDAQFNGSRFAMSPSSPSRKCSYESPAFGVDSVKKSSGASPYGSSRPLVRVEGFTYPSSDRHQGLATLAQ